MEENYALKDQIIQNNILKNVFFLINLLFKIIIYKKKKNKEYFRIFAVFVLGKQEFNLDYKKKQFYWI